MIHLIHTQPNADGYQIITNEFGAPEEKDTVMCCHCRRHIYVVPGSGKIRGFCTHHNKITCGATWCDECPDA